MAMVLRPTFLILAAVSVRRFAPVARPHHAAIFINFTFFDRTRPARNVTFDPPAAAVCASLPLIDRTMPTRIDPPTAVICASLAVIDQTMSTRVLGMAASHIHHVQRTALNGGPACFDVVASLISGWFAQKRSHGSFAQQPQQRQRVEGHFSD
jgi:hypothetical protein